MLSISISILALFLACSHASPTASAEPSLVHENAAAIVSLVPAGPVAAVQDTAGTALLFYQKTDASIWAWGTSGPFSSGSSNATANVQIVPAAEALAASPIAVSEIYQPFYDIGASFRLYFFSKTNVVSEYIWQNGVWRGGATCSDCLTEKGFTALASSKVLYAKRMQNGQALRVGFISQGIPGTLAEADSSGAGDWTLAGLPLAS